MVLTSIRQVGSLKPQVKVRELRVGQAEIPLIKRVMELATCPLYKRSESLMSYCDASQRALVVGVPARSVPIAMPLEI